MFSLLALIALFFKAYAVEDQAIGVLSASSLARCAALKRFPKGLVGLAMGVVLSNTQTLATILQVLGWNAKQFSVDMGERVTTSLLRL